MYVLKLPLGTGTPSTLVPSPSIEISIALTATDNSTAPTATATSEPTQPSDTHRPCEFTCLYTFMDYILCVLAYYVGIIYVAVSVAIVAGIVVVVLVGGALFIVVVRKRIKRSSMYTFHVHYIILPDVFLAFQEVFLAVLFW